MRDRPATTPAYQFTIPSLSDGISLDCRIYHPRVFEHDSEPTEDRWTKKAAIVAHPYAPLGGCQDDPVVMTTIAQLLDADLIVGTFNFRGAPGSRGSTSWSGKAEREDYISFAGLIIHYLTYLEVDRDPDVYESRRGRDQGHVRPTGGISLGKTISIIFGGYSYGSLIASQLPNVPSLLEHFKDPLRATISSEIILRARHLATRTNETREGLSAQRGRQQNSTSHGHKKSNSHSIVYGGQETPPSATRSSGSRERRSTDIPARIKSHLRRQSSRVMHRHSSHSHRTSDAHSIAQVEDDLPNVKAGYLLISPLLPPLSAFLSPSWSSFMVKIPEPDILIEHPTLIVYGSEDGFTSARRMRAWCKRMEARAGGRTFTRFEQHGAGHFWREHGALEGLTACIESWTENHIGAGSSRRLSAKDRNEDT